MRIGGYEKSSLVDFPGRVAAVVFTQGCNFRCPWCHNRQLVEPSAFGPTIPVDDIFRHLGGRVGKLSGVVVTGGEPTLQPDLERFLERACALGFATKLDTNGSNPAVVQKLLDRALVDFIAVDLKAPWSRYDEACGVRVDTTSIQETIQLLQTQSIPHHLRTTDWAGFAPGEREEIEVIAEESALVWQDFRALTIPT